MKVLKGPIYEPTGAALEYAPYALNLAVGCTHGCLYCYGPRCMHMTREEWTFPRIKANILEKLEKQASQMIGFEPEVLLSFATDPYCTPEIAATTNKALNILAENYFKNVSVLTKAGIKGYLPYNILKENGWKFGSTICFSKRNEVEREKWEPGASTILERYIAVKEMKSLGIYTWISLEPVINPVEALRVIDDLKYYADYWKIGKINYHKEIEQAVNWHGFVRDVKRALPPEKYYLKESLRRYE